MADDDVTAARRDWARKFRLRVIAMERLLGDIPVDPIPTPASDDADRAARELVTALHLYGGYSVSSRGPRGCIMDALRAIAPEVHAELCEADAEPGEVYRRRWGDD